MKKLVLFGFLISCGGQQQAVLPHDLSVDNIGKAANDVRKYFSDRNISGEDLQNFETTSSRQTEKAYQDAEHHVGKKANEARKHLSDRNISGEDLQNFETQAAKDINAEGNRFDDNASSRAVFAKNHIGKKANETREYTYARGIQEMRHGDKTLTNQVEDHEARLRVLERISKAHSELLVNLFDISAAEKEARMDADQALTDALNAETSAREASDLAEKLARMNDVAAEQAVREAADAAEFTARQQADNELSTQFANELTETSSFLQGQLDVIREELDNLTSQVNSQGSSISDIQEHLSSVDNTLESLSDRIDCLKHLVKMNSKSIKKLKKRLNKEIAARKAKDHVLAHMICDVQQDINSLTNALSNLTDRVENAESAIESLEGVTEALSAAIDNIELIPGPMGPVGPQGPAGSNAQSCIVSKVAIGNGSHVMCSNDFKITISCPSGSVVFCSHE